MPEEETQLPYTVHDAAFALSHKIGATVIGVFYDVNPHSVFDFSSEGTEVTRLGSKMNNALRAICSEHAIELPSNVDVTCFREHTFLQMTMSSEQSLGTEQIRQLNTNIRALISGALTADASSLSANEQRFRLLEELLRASKLLDWEFYRSFDDVHGLHHETIQDLQQEIADAAKVLTDAKMSGADAVHTNPDHPYFQRAHGLIDRGSSLSNRVSILYQRLLHLRSFEINQGANVKELDQHGVFHEYDKLCNPVKWHHDEFPQANRQFVLKQYPKQTLRNYKWDSGFAFHLGLKARVTHNVKMRAAQG